MVDELINFIDNHWRKDHIFVRNRELFDFQHKNGAIYNFILARQDGNIIGILGFIPTSQYSEALKVNNELWLAIWKVRDDIKKPGLGLMMLNYLKKYHNNPTICSLGLSQQVIPIYKALKYNVGVLNHSAFFNQKKCTLTFVVPKINYIVNCINKFVEVDFVKKIDNLHLDDNIFDSHPKKNLEYLVNRYSNHPSYIYDYLIFKEENKLLSIVVYRSIVIGDVKIARVIDILGESIMVEKFNYSISRFLDKYDFEYLDIVSTFRSEARSGFISNSNSLTIPNYFEPLEMKNISVDYAYKSNIELSIFRGDSDQDRPNI
ncbi:MAG: hypothetical protein V7749_08675 [Cocleimonas sp.]